MRFLALPQTRVRLLLLLSVLLLSVMLSGGGLRSAFAQPPASLELVPADIAFYSASLRLREQYDNLIGSKAFAKLKEMSIVQMGWAMFQGQWSNPEGKMAHVRAMLEQPENQELIAMLVDAMSQETFFYGDDVWGESLAFLNELNEVNRAVQLESIGNPSENAGKKMAASMLQLLANRLDSLQVPTTVVGFHLQETARAERQIRRVEQLAGLLLAQQPDFEGRLTREQVAGASFLTLKLDGSLLPWDQLPPDLGADVDDVQRKISKMTLVISIGIQGDFLLFSIGETNNHLSELGKGPPLAARREVAAFDEHGHRKITSIVYVSESLMTQANTVGRQVDQVVHLAESLVPLAPLDPDLQDEIIEDARSLATDIKASVPRSGAVSAIGFMTAGGYERISYSWGENRRLDSSQPLPILNQVGGSPLLMLAARRVYAPEAFDQMVKWSQRLFYYFETMGVAQLDEATQQFYQNVRGDMVRLLSDVGQVTRQKLLPALKDGQTALVVDAKTASKQWHASLPANSEPLPGPELAIVYGVSDPVLLKEAAADYLRIAKLIAEVLHRADPDRVPEIKLSAPEVQESGSGTIYYYKLPPSLGVDPQVAPNAGLSNDTLAFSFVPKMTLRLIEPTKLRATGPLANAGRPLAAAASFDFAGLLEALLPWLDYYGFVLANEDIAPGVRQQIGVGIEIAQCFRGVSGVTYRTSEAMISHYEFRFEDLK